jgi:hypothetical protein
MTWIKPPIFDVSGVDGASGTTGMSRGLSGGHGTEGQCGTSAGTIAVRLTTPRTIADIPKNVVLPNPIDAKVKFDASITAAGWLEKMDTELTIKSGESICFRALGGHGGHGGDGAKGVRYGGFSCTLL